MPITFNYICDRCGASCNNDEGSITIEVRESFRDMFLRSNKYIFCDTCRMRFNIVIHNLLNCEVKKDVQQ